MIGDIRQFRPDWWDEAMCANKGLSVFFGERSSYVSIVKARQYCSACPVIKDCLAHALSIPEEFGIWAGTSAGDRATMVVEIRNGLDKNELIDSVVNNSFNWKKAS